MAPNSHQPSTSTLIINDLIIEVVRKDIKNLHLAVYPPDGHVRIAAPHRLDDDTIRRAVISRLRWIRRQQTGFAEQDRQSAREMVTGESHYLAGHRYRLDLVETPGRPSIRIRNRTILELRVPPDSTRDDRNRILQRWYRRELRGHIPALIAKWEPILGVTVADWRIKKMKTRWGACSIDAARIWLNLELAKKPLPCLEYIIVHEMTHLLERTHNDRFRSLMDHHLPDWPLRRTQLNSSPLAHEDRAIASY